MEKQKSPAKKITPEMVKGILRTVVEPELGADLITLGYIDSVEVKGNQAIVNFHLTSPFSPLAEFMGIEIRRALSEGGIDAKVFITDHQHKDDVNEYVNWIKLKNVNFTLKP
jgi:ATP-binding protein involved in chromosome partitioning